MHTFRKIIYALSIAWLAFPAVAQTLDESMRLALINHPSLDIAQSDIDLASEELVSARAARSIQISAGVTSQLQSTSTNRAFAIDIGDTWVNQASIEASIPVFTSGEIPAGIRQAEFSLEAAEFALAARKQEVLAAALSVHLDVVLAQNSVRIRERNAERLTRQFEAAQDRFEAGIVTRTDVSLAEARLRGAEAELAAERATLEAARGQYVRVTGEEPVALSTVSAPLELPANLDEAISILNMSNPSLLRLDTLELLAGEAIRVAESRRGARVELFGSASLQDGRWDNQFRDESVVIGGRASIALYTGGRLDSAVRQAGLNREQIRFQHEDARLSLTASLVEAWAAHNAAQSAIIAVEQEIEANQFALDGAEIEVSVGLRTTLDLLDQEQDLLEAQLRLAQAERNLVLSSSQILALLGQLDA